MLDCAESFYDGTWSSGPLPEEVEDFELMAEFGWTYTLIKGPAGWKMVSIYSHDSGKALTCGA